MFGQVQSTTGLADIVDRAEFRQIAHSGGRITVRVTTQPDGRRLCQLEWGHSRACGAGFFGVHVLPPGIPVGTAELGGIGSPIDPGPVPGNTLVFITSDSEAMYGAECPQCNAYWRSESPSLFCVNCGLTGAPHVFLTRAHAVYIQQYCRLFSEAMTGADGDYVIDLDAVADAVDSADKPPFYFAEESQQNKFKCSACGCTVDILGNFGYCSRCGTRNDLQELESKAMKAIRERINSQEQREACVRDAVAAFDSFVGQYVRELVRRVPLTKARMNRLQSSRFHNIAQTREELKTTFDIDLFRGVDSSDQGFAVMMFARRHVYEHKGGEADEEYIVQSGDTTVRPKQALRETQESAHRIVGTVLKLARNLHEGFHEIIPTNERAIARSRRVWDVR